MHELMFRAGVKTYIIESVDSIGRDVSIYVMHYKIENISVYVQSQVF